MEKRLGHRIDAIQPAQIIAFRKIYTSIKEGMSEPKDWFELPTETGAESPAQTEAAAPEQEESTAKPTGKKRAKNPEPVPADEPPFEPDAEQAAAPAAMPPSSESLIVSIHAPVRGATNN